MQTSDCLKKIRNPAIDILRGLCIIFVVMGHCGFPYTKLLYSFHVPLFFLISGMVEKPFHISDTVPIKNFVIKKLTRLYVPFVVFSIVELLLHNFLIDLHIYISEENILCSSECFQVVTRYSNQEMLLRFFKAFVFAGGSQLGGALWFFKILFFSSIFFKIECFLLRKNSKRMLFLLIINFVFYAIGAVLFAKKIYLPLGFEIMFSVMIFYYIGFLIHNHFKSVETLICRKKIVCAIVSFVPLLFSYSFQNVDIGRHVMTNPLLLLLTTFCGFVFCYSLSLILSKVKIGNVINYVGNNTVCIVLLHFLAFKLVNLALIWQKGLDMSYLAAFPFLDRSMWPLYVIVGCALPLMFNYVSLYTVHLIYKRK